MVIVGFLIRKPEPSSCVHTWMNFQVFIAEFSALSYLHYSCVCMYVCVCVCVCVCVSCGQSRDAAICRQSLSWRWTTIDEAKSRLLQGTETTSMRTRGRNTTLSRKTMRKFLAIAVISASNCRHETSWIPPLLGHVAAWNAPHASERLCAP
jgi:hypothetical protein